MRRPTSGTIFAPAKPAQVRKSDLLLLRWHKSAKQAREGTSVEDRQLGQIFTKEFRGQLEALYGRWGFGPGL